MTRRLEDIAWSLAYAAATCLLVISLAWGGAQEERNVLAGAELVQPAITLPAVVVGVHDGDTLTVEGTWRVNVRLKNVWAAELRDAGGREALSHIQQLTKTKKCLLAIPLDGARDIGDVLTFGRVVGEIWMDGQCESVNMRMVRDGFATRERPR